MRFAAVDTSNATTSKLSWQLTAFFDILQVFERVARPVVVSALDGFNGTIFAYGQTGSGKTFTITGGVERYIDRGIIPRTITCIYAELAKRSDFTFQVTSARIGSCPTHTLQSIKAAVSNWALPMLQVHVSYLEIYNETGYDLLDPTRECRPWRICRRWGTEPNTATLTAAAHQHPPAQWLPHVSVRHLRSGFRYQT